MTEQIFGTAHVSWVLDRPLPVSSDVIPQARGLPSIPCIGTLSRFS